jgi:hypothetical protein
MGEMIGRWLRVEFDSSDGTEDEFELVVDVEVLCEEFVDGEFGVVDHCLVGLLEFCQQLPFYVLGLAHCRVNVKFERRMGLGFYCCGLGQQIFSLIRLRI